MKLNARFMLIIALLLSFVAQPIFAQYELDKQLPVDPNVKIGKLPNGLTYYIRKNAKPEKKAELRLIVNAGSILEDKDQLGLAHFMEHMGFNGSKNFPKNELVNYLQKIGVEFGADLNAYTSFDETVYILPIPTDDKETVEKGFTVLEDWAGNNLMDAAEIEKERGVVLEESRLSKGADERMSRKYFPRLFNNSKYAERLPIGKDSILQHFKPEALKRFYTDWYRPDLMAVAVVGDIDVNEAEALIKKHFGQFKKPAAPRERPAITPIATWTKPEAMVLTDEEATNTILQMYNFVKPSKPAKTWGEYRQNLVEEIVTSLINQRLTELTQKENPPFVFGFSGYTPFVRGYKAFVSFAVLGNDEPQKAIDALISETQRARQFGFLAGELDRVKATLLNQTEKAYNERDKSLSGGIVQAYVSNFLEGTPIPGIAHRYNFIQQVLPTVTLEEINKAAQQMPVSTNSFALLTAPASMQSKLPDEKTLLHNVVAAYQKPVTAYEEKSVATALLDKSPTPGKVTAEKVNSKLETTDLTLSNGVTITLKPTNFKNDEIKMDAWRWGGFHKAALAEKQNAQYSAQIVQQMGVKDLSPTDLKKFLSGKTVNVSPYVNPHEEGIEGSSSVKDFETFLQLVHLYFTQPRKDEGLYKSFVSKQKSMFQFMKQSPEYFYQDTMSKIIYNNNPWAGQLPSEKEFEKLDLDKAFASYTETFGNAHGMHFTFVGNIDPATAKPLLEKYLGSLPASPKENAFKDNGVRPVKGKVIANIQKGKEQQSYITLVFTGDTKYSQDEVLRLNALTEVLNIQIIEKLREEMSGIYGGGLFGSITNRPYEHYTIGSSIPAGPENVGKLTTALFELIEKAQKEGVEQKDLDKVKETWKKQHRENMESNDYWLTQLSNAWINREDPEYVLNYEKKVDALTVKDLQEAAKKYLNLNEYIKVVLYPESFKIPDSEKKAF